MHQSQGTPTASASSSTPAEPDRYETVERIMVGRPREEVYAFWRDFANIPRFMEKVERVATVDSLSSLWTVRVGEDEIAEWEFMVTDDDPGRLIAWSTSGKTSVKYSGRVEFKDVPADDAAPAGGDSSARGDLASVPSPQGTEVTVTLRHEPEGVLESLVSIISAPPQLLQTGSDLLRLKELLEKGVG